MRPVTDAACGAVQFSDQMQCARCGLAWDVNEPEPPKCRGDRPRYDPGRKKGRRVLAGLLRDLRG